MVGVIEGSNDTIEVKYSVMVMIWLYHSLTIHCSVVIDRSLSHSIDSKHCNIVGYSWYTRHCVASHRRVHLCVYQCLCCSVHSIYRLLSLRNNNHG